MKYANFGSLSALPVSQVQIAGYAYQINYLAYLIEKIQKDISTLDPEDQGEAISTLQAAVEALQTTVAGKSTVTANPAATGSETALNRIEIDGVKYTVSGGGTSGTGNVSVVEPSQATCYDSHIYLTYDELPEGTVIDKIEMVVNASGGTYPQLMTIYMTGTSTGVSAAPEGGYAIWNIAPVTNTGVTINSLYLTSTNTLFTHTPKNGDTVSHARIYYHI